MNDDDARFSHPRRLTISGNHNRTGSLARPDCSLHSSARLNARDALFSSGNNGHARQSGARVLGRGLAPTRLAPPRDGFHAPWRRALGTLKPRRWRRDRAVHGHRHEMPASARRNAASARRGGVRAWLFAATLAACLASASPRSTQESLGFGAKSAAAIPSYAVSGEPAVLAVHGLNFAPGGAHPTSSPSLARGLRAPRLAAFSTFSTSLSLSRARADTRADTRADAVPAFAFAIRRHRIRRLLVPALFPARGARAVPL